MPSLNASVLNEIEEVLPLLDEIYQDFHRHPELSLYESRTASKLAGYLRDTGFDVTEKVGGHGIVGVFENGSGPVILLRTDMDALPIREQTGLPYASEVTFTLPDGNEVPVMHACGHDIHMVSALGAAMLLVKAREQWQGTLLFVGQPAEELLAGARNMIDDGLFDRFPKPDYALAIHVTNLLASNQVGIIPGPAGAASNAVDIIVYGTGGHGARPHLTVDPILIASRIVVTLQQIVARELNPWDPAVVTVGSFQAGTARNIIPDEAKLALTVRSYDQKVQKHLLDAIARIAKAESMASGADRAPEVIIHPEAAEVVFNDLNLSERFNQVLGGHFGAENVHQLPPLTSSEDFSLFGHVAGIPSLQLRVGSVEPGKFHALKEKGEYAPGVHTPYYAPDRLQTIRSGVASFVLMTLELLESSQQ